MELISKRTVYKTKLNHEEMKVLLDGLVLLEEKERSDIGIKAGVIEDLISNIEYILALEK